MVRFWDASALVPIFLNEPQSELTRTWYATDPGVIVWALTRIELLSAIARRDREDPAEPAPYRIARDKIARVWPEWFEIGDLVAVAQHAERLLLAHPVRAADALQLGAAIVAAESQPATLEFVTLDRRLGAAAAREGFPVVGVI